jgi:hypothetical protein
VAKLLNVRAKYYIVQKFGSCKQTRLEWCGVYVQGSSRSTIFRFNPSVKKVLTIISFREAHLWFRKGASGSRAIVWPRVVVTRLRAKQLAYGGSIPGSLTDRNRRLFSRLSRLRFSLRGGRGGGLQNTKREYHSLDRDVSLSLIYCKGFDQSIARQRLSKHFPICNDIRETVFSMWSGPSKNRNWVLCDQLLGYATVLTIELCFLCGPCRGYITRFPE